MNAIHIFVESWLLKLGRAVSERWLLSRHRRLGWRRCGLLSGTFVKGLPNKHSYTNNGNDCTELLDKIKTKWIRRQYDYR